MFKHVKTGLVLTLSSLAKSNLHHYLTPVSPKSHILVVDDEIDIAQLIRYNLEKEGFLVSVLHSGDGVLPFLLKNKMDLVVLDLMLPGINGLDLCRAIKCDADLKNIPVILLTAKAQESDVITGFDMGADDYVTKPFSVKVLLARIRTALRKKSEPSVASLSDKSKSEVLNIHKIHIDVGHRLVESDAKPVELTHTEFQILYLLAKNPGWVYSRYQIVDAIRGENYAVTERSVDVQIVGLRKKLGDGGRFIETVRGVGYRMKGTSHS